MARLLVGHSVAILSHAKMAEPIEMLFGLWWVHRTEPCIRWGPDHSLEGGNFERGKHCLHGKWLAEKARSTIFLEWNTSFGEKKEKERSVFI